jgi:pyruvate formate lyase activating enzyme
MAKAGKKLLVFLFVLLYNLSMVFMGMQKLTLLDYPTKTAAVLFSQGCNFCCPFCHNRDLVVGNSSSLDSSSLDSSSFDSFSEDYVLDFLKKRKGKLEGVVFSGGEPLLQNDLGAFMAKVKALGFKIKLDTNGFLPDKLLELYSSGLLDYVAMDIKNSSLMYAKTVGKSEFDIEKIKRSIQILLFGSVEYEFRTTLVKEFHTIDDILQAAEMIVGAKRYYLQNFQSGDTIVQGLHGFSNQELMEILKRVQGIVPNSFLRGI